MNLDEPSDLALAEVRRAQNSLRTIVHLAILCGIVLSATLFVYLANELATLRARNDELTAFVTKYNQSFVPLAENARTNLAAFARAHPTLAPILQKHYGTNSPDAK